MTEWPVNVLAVGAFLASFMLSYTVRYFFGEYSVYGYVPIIYAVITSMIKKKHMIDANWAY